MKVIIVDDDPVLCELLTEALTGLGFCDVLTALDGTAAIELYKQYEKDIALITCDLHMPNVDGVEFINFLTKKNCDCPILLLSSAHDTVRKCAELLAGAAQLNVIGSLKKPLNLDELKQVTRDIPREHQSDARTTCLAS